ncbi:MAG: type II toxin-antitoxin system HicB family antitoxin [Chloroflexia bacterium]|nr:type II toxin-antitoxin system HicB family antitoxin [Chloroflexia bacterium]
MKDNHVNLFYSNADDGYIADIPDLAACSAFGATAAEALAELEIARAALIDAAHAHDKPVPEPRYRTAIYQFTPGTTRHMSGWG